MAYANQAADIANQVFAGTEAALRAQQQFAASKNAADIAALQGLQQTGAGQINQSYEGLLSDLSRNRAGAIDAHNQALTGMGNAYNQGFESAAQAQQASRDYIEQLAQRIGGVSFGDRVPLAQEAQEATFNRIGEINRARAQDLLNAFSTWSTQQDTSYGRTEENMRGRQAQDITGFNSDIGRRMSEAQMAGREQELAALMALAELGTKKGSMSAQLAQQFAQMEMQAQEANARLAQSADELSFRREQAALDRAAAAAGPDPWEKEKFYASLGFDKERAAAADAQWAAEFGDTGPNTYTGRQGMEAFLQHQGRNPGLADVVDRAFAYVATNPKYLGQDPYAIVSGNRGSLINEMFGPGQRAPQIDQNLWRQLAAIHAGNY